MLINNAAINLIGELDKIPSQQPAAGYFKSEKAVQKDKLKSIDKYLEIVEELNSIPISMLRFAYDKVSVLLGLNRLTAEHSVKDFKELINIFRVWDRFYNEDMKEIMIVEFKDIGTSEVDKITAKCKQFY